MQNGTSLQELQQLGGWSSFEMVLRYAHLSSAHNAANRIGKIEHDKCEVNEGRSVKSVTNLLHTLFTNFQYSLNSLILMT